MKIEDIPNSGTPPKKKITLTRSDLAQHRKDVAFEDVSMFDLKRYMYQYRKIQQAELVVFQEGENVKVLKGKKPYAATSESDLIKDFFEETPTQEQRIRNILLELNMVVTRLIEHIGEEEYFKRLKEKAPYLSHKSLLFGTLKCEYTILEIAALEDIFGTRIIRIGDFDYDDIIHRNEIPKKKPKEDKGGGLMVLTPDKGIISADED